MKEAEVVVEFHIEEEAEDEQTSIKQQFNVKNVIDLDISNMNVPL
jgi:tRNA threonylcarbamoyladenosine modification (KEOPS) complex  Pcc1 subunit